MGRQGKRRTSGEKCRSVRVQSRANRYGTPTRPVKTSRGKNRRPILALRARATITRHEMPLELLRGQPGRLRLGTGLGTWKGRQLQQRLDATRKEVSLLLHRRR